MPTVIIAQILTFIQLALTAAPEIAKLVAKAKTLIDALFTAKLITVEQQNELHAHIDALATAVLTGGEPPHWKVDPDPLP